MPHLNQRKGSVSSLSEVAVFSPRRVPVNHSPMSPARVRSLKSSSSSMSPCSPKTSLLSKAVSGTCQQVGRKRRLLPAIPDSKPKPDEASRIFSPPGQCSSQLVDGADKKTASVLQSAKMNEKELFKEAVFGDSIKPLRAGDTCVNMGTSKQAQHSSDACKEDKNVFGQRSLDAIPENSSSKGIGNQASESEKQTVALSNDQSLEELLKKHNKKIVSARSQYDENGRKIRTAEPSFCPAPSKKPPLSLSSSAACKRPAASVDKPTVSAKQKRRSCMATVSNVPSERTKSNTHSSNKNTNVNKKDKESSNLQAAKQKRRSCMASLQNGGQANMADRELRDLIAQHNSRLSAKRS